MCCQIRLVEVVLETMKHQQSRNTRNVMVGGDVQVPFLKKKRDNFYLLGKYKWPFKRIIELPIVHLVQLPIHCSSQ